LSPGLWIRIVFFYADLEPEPAQKLDADPDPDSEPGGGGGVGQPKMCIPPGKILGTPLVGGITKRGMVTVHLGIYLSSMPGLSSQAHTRQTEKFLSCLSKEHVIFIERLNKLIALVKLKGS
jgi:hypothetical protein